MAKEASSQTVTRKRMSCDRMDLAERIFNGVRTPILALSLVQEGPPKIVDCNQAALDLIGYERSEVVDRSVEVLNSKGHPKGDLWKPFRAAGKRSFNIVGHELARKDGTVFLADLKVSPLLNGKGRQVGSITVLSDLTQRNKMEARRLQYEDRLMALHRHSTQLGSATTIDAIVDFTLQAMQETLSVRHVDFNLVEKDHVRMVKSAGMPLEDASVKLPRNGPGVIVKAANTRKTLLIPDTRKEPSFVDARVFDPAKGPMHILSELATPVLVDGEAVAVLNVESDTPNAFSGEDQRYLEFIAFHAAAAFKRLKYEEKLSALHRHANELSVATSIDEIASHTLDAMEFALGFDHSDIRVVQDGWLKLKGARGMEMINADLRLDGPGVTVKAANSKETIRVPDTTKEPSYVDRVHDKGPESPTMLSELAVPVVVEGQTVAVLNAESSKRNAITDSDQRLLEILTTHVVSAIRRMKDQGALANERNLLRTLIDNLPDYIFVKDSESRFVVNNLAHAHVLRAKTPDQMVGKTDYDIFPPELAASYHADEQAVIRSGQPLLSREERTIDPEGKTQWLLTTKVPLRDDQGKVIGLVGISRDITERKRMEETLANERNVLRTLIDALPDNIFIKDAESRFLISNLAHARLLRAKTPDEVVGKTDFDIFPPELAASYYADEQAVIQSGQPLLSREERTIDPEGKTRWLLTTKVPLRDDHGKAIGIAGINHDITKRKQMEDQLRESENRYRTLFDSTNDAIFIHDMGGKFLEVNKVACERLGYSREELLQMTPADIDAAEHSATVQQRVEELNRIGHHFAEIIQVRRDGTTLPTELSSRLIEFKGKPAILSIARDITKRKLAEEALRESEEKYRRLFEQAMDGIALADPETGIILDCNQALAALVGRDRAELIGQHQAILHPPARDGSAFSPTFKLHLTTHEGQVLETQVITSTGQIREVEIKANLLYLQGRKTLQGIFHDITERRQLMEKLRESEDRFRGLAERSLDVIFTTDQEGRITYISPAVKEALGYKPEEVVGQSIQNYLPESEIPKALQALSQTLGGRVPEYVEFEVRRKDGSLASTWISASSIVRDGAVIGAQVILRDITERKRAEDMIRHQTVLLQKTFDSMTDAIFILDAVIPPASPTIIECNEAASKIFGYSEAEMLGRNTAFLHVSDETLKEFQSLLFAAASEGRLPFRLPEFRMKRKDGSIFPSEHSVSQLLNDKSERTGWVSIVRDITERKRAEEALKDSVERETAKETVRPT
jgi:PAS domain S-box-containing protein